MAVAKERVAAPFTRRARRARNRRDVPTRPQRNVGRARRDPRRARRQHPARPRPTAEVLAHPLAALIPLTTRDTAPRDIHEAPFPAGPAIGSTFELRTRTATKQSLGALAPRNGGTAADPPLMSDGATAALRPVIALARHPGQAETLAATLLVAIALAESRSIAPSDSAAGLCEAVTASTLTPP